jgi:hypothetical protein
MDEITTKKSRKMLAKHELGRFIEVCPHHQPIIARMIAEKKMLGIS